MKARDWFNHMLDSAYDQGLSYYEARLFAWTAMIEYWQDAAATYAADAAYAADAYADAAVDAAKAHFKDFEEDESCEDAESADGN